MQHKWHVVRPPNKKSRSSLDGTSGSGPIHDMSPMGSPGYMLP